MACVTGFRTEADRVERNLVEIKSSGAMGKGVFAKANIPRLQLLGEYLGELLPNNTPVQVSDQYVFILGQECIITSQDYGNWTRFVNHNCRPNVAANSAMYGHRRAVVFRAVRDIPAGEELSIWYGRDYFTGMNINCACNAEPAPHLPSGRGPRFPWPRP